MRKYIILLMLLLSGMAAEAQFPVRGSLVVLRRQDTILFNPQYGVNNGLYWQHTKYTKPMLMQLDTCLRVIDGSLWWDGLVGATPTSGAGARTMIIPSKYHAFRCGAVGGTFWDDANIGNASAAFGINNKASGIGSFVSGHDNGAIGNYSAIFGSNDSIDSNGALSFIGGSCGSIISTQVSFIGGGTGHKIPYDASLPSRSACIGGQNSTNCGSCSVILGGRWITTTLSDSNRVFMRAGIFRLWESDKRDLTQWQLNTGTIKSKVDTSGRFDINKAVYIRHDTTATNASKTLLSFIGTTSGTAAADHGFGIMGYLEKNTGSVINTMRIRNGLTHANGSSYVSFWTYNGNAGTFTEKMRIDSVGLLVNTTSELTTSAYRLQVSGGIYASSTIQSVTTGTFGTSVQAPIMCPPTDVDYNIGLRAATAGKWINFATTLSGTQVNVMRINNYGGVVYVPKSLAVVAATGIPSTSFSKQLEIAGSGGAVDISANPQIAAGTTGQEIMFICTSDVNTVKFDDGTGLQLAGGASFTMGSGDVLVLTYNGTLAVWVEVSRSDN